MTLPIFHLKIGKQNCLFSPTFVLLSILLHAVISQHVHILSRTDFPKGPNCRLVQDLLQPQPCRTDQMSSDCPHAVIIVNTTQITSVAALSLDRWQPQSQLTVPGGWPSAPPGGEGLGTGGGGLTGV